MQSPRHEQRTRTRLICASAGILFPAVLFGLYWALLYICHLDDDVTGLLAMFLGYIGIGWCSAFFAALACRRVVQQDFSLFSVFLTNSAAWMSLALVILFFLAQLKENTFGQQEVAIAVFVVVFSAIGFAISWRVMRPPTLQTVQQRQSEEEPHQPGHFKDAFLAFFVAIGAVLGLLLWLVWKWR